jgi:hypothetical protein
MEDEKSKPSFVGKVPENAQDAPDLRFTVRGRGQRRGVEDLEAALEQFYEIAADLGTRSRPVESAGVDTRPAAMLLSMIAIIILIQKATRSISSAPKIITDHATGNPSVHTRRFGKKPALLDN